MVNQGDEVMPLLKDYITLNKLGLSILGVWPLDDDAPKWRENLQNVHIAVIYLLLLGLLVPQLLDLYIFRGNIQANAENLCTSLTTFTVLAKLSNFVAKRHSLKVAIRELEANWNRTMQPTVPKIHRDLLVRAANVSRAVTRRYCIIMYVTASMYFVLPLITDRDSSTQRPRKYPFCAWYYYDRTSDVIYVALYLSQVVIGLSCGTGNYSMDSLFLVMVHHVCAQLRILQREFRMVGTSGLNTEFAFPPRCRDKTLTDAEILETTKHVVRLHERHIQCYKPCLLFLAVNARNLKAVFNGATLQQLCVSSVIICVIGFKLIVSLDASRFESMIYLTYTHLVILQIYLYCSPGDDLSNEVFLIHDVLGGGRYLANPGSIVLAICKPSAIQRRRWCVQSIEIGRAAYECPWMDLPSSVTRCLLITTMRSRRPLSISAGNFIVMSMPNFTTILRTSLSYLSVLRAIYDDKHVLQKH